MSTVNYVTIAADFPTIYSPSIWAFMHLDVKASEDSIGSWDRHYAENFQLAVL